MPKLSGQTVMSLQELIVDDQTAADTGADRQIQNIVMSASGTKFPLCKTGEICIVIQIGWNSEMLC